MKKNLKLKLYILFAIILSDFIAQIPYTIHLYGVQRLITPTLGWFAMISVFLLFLIGFILLINKKVIGLRLLVFFLTLEFLFYFFNESFGLLHGFGIIYHLRNDEPILKTVFLIGFINLFASGYFLYLLLRNRSEIGNRATLKK